ncbi:MAG: CesT family type III secretion system chaperone [Bilophila wadsworthia]
MELASLIEDLGKACGLELTLDEGRCTLRFDGEHDVTIERDGNAVILHGIAGDGGCLSNPDNLRILLLPVPRGRGDGALSVWNAPGKSCSGSSLTPSRTIRTRSRHQCVLAQLIHWARRRPAVRGGARFGHIHPRRIMV